MDESSERERGRGRRAELRRERRPGRGLYLYSLGESDGKQKGGEGSLQIASLAVPCDSRAVLVHAAFGSRLIPPGRRRQSRAIDRATEDRTLARYPLPTARTTPARPHRACNRDTRSLSPWNGIFLAHSSFCGLAQPLLDVMVGVQNPDRTLWAPPRRNAPPTRSPYPRQRQLLRLTPQEPGEATSRLGSFQ